MNNKKCFISGIVNSDTDLEARILMHYRNLQGGIISLVKMIIIITTEGKDIERTYLSGKFPSVRKNLGSIFSVLYILVRE